MDLAFYLEAIRRESATFAAAARRDLEAAVPSCPDWDVAELVRHLGRVQRWVTGGLQAGATERFERGPKPPQDGVIDWFEDGAAALLATLAEVGLDRLVWNFAGDGPGPSSWWFRRQAHEAAVHRWDAEAATGEGTPIETELAADGIDEFLTIVLPPDMSGTGCSRLHLHRTDGAGEWMVRFSPGPTEVTREHGKGDTAVRGAASDILLWLSNRSTGDGLEVFGDATLVARWPELVRF